MVVPDFTYVMRKRSLSVGSINLKEIKPVKFTSRSLPNLTFVWSVSFVSPDVSQSVVSPSSLVKRPVAEPFQVWHDSWDDSGFSSSYFSPPHTSTPKM